MLMSNRNYDIEIFHEKSGVIYVFSILLPSGNLDAIYSRNEQETVMSVTPAYEVPDIVQIAFYRERNNLLKNAT